MTALAYQDTSHYSLLQWLESGGVPFGRDRRLAPCTM